MRLAKTLLPLLLLALMACKEGIRASKDGAILYQASCVTCHGMDGHGTPLAKRWNVPDFADPKVQARSDDDLTAVIKNGRNQMPPWGGVYTPEQIRSLVAHLRTLK